MYDADPMNRDNALGDGNGPCCNGGHSCPDFALHEKSKTVKLIDKAHNVVDLKIQEYNEFVDRIKSRGIRKINPLLRGEKEYSVGGIRFMKGEDSDIVVETAPNGDTARMSIKHFDIFVDAVLEGKMDKVNPHVKKRYGKIIVRHT